MALNNIISDAATNVDPVSLFDWVSKGGFIGLVCFIVLAGFKRWWVYGWQYKEALDRVNKLELSNAKWMELALRGTKVAESLVEKPNQNT